MRPQCSVVEKTVVKYEPVVVAMEEEAKKGLVKADVKLSLHVFRKVPEMTADGDVRKMCVLLKILGVRTCRPP